MIEGNGDLFFWKAGSICGDSLVKKNIPFWVEIWEYFNLSEGQMSVIIRYYKCLKFPDFSIDIFGMLVDSILIFLYLDNLLKWLAFEFWNQMFKLWFSLKLCQFEYLFNIFKMIFRNDYLKDNSGFEILFNKI